MEKEQYPSIFVTKVTEDVVEKLKEDLEDQGFTLTKPPYTHFAAKKKGVVCTLYTSLKLTVQGKEMAQFIEFYLEPQILKNTTFSYPQEEAFDGTARIGVDEAGKGDFFGPLCVAAFYGAGDDIKKLKKMGVKDSKNLSDSQVLKIASELRKGFKQYVVIINPTKYNELYTKFRNLNHLLAWGHATAIENVQKMSHCRYVVIDKFAHESVVEQAVKYKKLEVELVQKHKAEEDVVVAAASILARAAFLEVLSEMARHFKLTFPKGASEQVKEAGKQFVRKYGKDALAQVGKMHFRTSQEIINAEES